MHNGTWWIGSTTDAVLNQLRSESAYERAENGDFVFTTECGQHKFYFRHNPFEVLPSTSENPIIRKWVDAGRLVRTMPIVFSLADCWTYCDAQLKYRAYPIGVLGRDTSARDIEFIRRFQHDSINVAAIKPHVLLQTLLDVESIGVGRELALKLTTAGAQLVQAAAYGEFRADVWVRVPAASAATKFDLRKAVSEKGMHPTVFHTGRSDASPSELSSIESYHPSVPLKLPHDPSELEEVLSTWLRITLRRECSEGCLVLPDTEVVDVHLHISVVGGAYVHPEFTLRFQTSDLKNRG